MDHDLNPAGRLWSLLDYLNSNGDPKQPILSALTEFLGVEKAYSAELYTALASIQGTPAKIRAAVDSLMTPAIPKDILVEGIPEAEAALQHLATLSSPLERMRARYNAGTLNSLRTTSFILMGASSKPNDLPADALNDAAKLVADLNNLLLTDGSLDPELKRVLGEHVLAMNTALMLYKVDGVEGILGRSDELRGRLFRQPELIEAAKKSPKTLEGLRKLLICINTVAGIMNGAVAIENGFDNLFAIESSPTSETTVAPDEHAPPTAL